jgi:D-alanyl-D-alanine dipeptidase
MPNCIYFFIFLFFWSFLSCIPAETRQEYVIEPAIDSSSIKDLVKPIVNLPKKDSVEQKMLQTSLISIDQIDSSILVSLQYADTHNFMHKNMYGSLTKAYMTLETAEKLHKAQAYLRELDPNLSILILDAARPQSIQKMMWDSVSLPRSERSKYLMNPSKISGHNYGISVDVTLFDTKTNKPLDMGSSFDHFGKASEPRFEDQLHQDGILTKEHLDNRKMLRTVMIKAGFTSIVSEWWHFNAMSRASAAKRYPIIP